MLITITILIAVAFAAFYPLTFWISSGNPLKSNFHRFHTGLPTVIAGIAAVGCYLKLPLSPATDMILGVWSVLLLLSTLIYWNRSHPDPLMLTIPSIFGILGYGMLQMELVGPGETKYFAGLLGGAILTTAMYAMNLGHWYLNVHGLPVSHLRRTVFVFWFLVGIRTVFDAVQLAAATVIEQGDILPLYRFLLSLDGFLVTIAIFFGTLFPLLALYFVKGTLDVKSTQSATGILYVILVAIFIGEITYKYCLIKFGIIL